jgi:predicted ribosome quality control (RQC) complex YloA/Tae2 family protein
MMQAAAVAAYYSKMKKASHVAVSMCEGKFVRKPSGAAPGTVTIEREEVLFVDPSIPHAEKD